MKAFKIIENLNFFKNHRGELRKTKIYPVWKFLKGIGLIFDWRLYNLYSREIFRDNLNYKQGNLNVYSHWIRSFFRNSERGWESIYDSHPMPWMYIKAVHFIEWHLLRTTSPKVFEWGGGTSTLWFAERSNKVITVENNIQWINTLHNRITELGIKNIELLVKEPINLKSRNPFETAWKEFKGYSFESYVNSIDAYDCLFDLILVDGYCRPECAKKALKKLNKNGILVFDNSSRERYKKFFENISKTHRIIKLEGPTTYGQGYSETTIITQK